MTGPDPRAGELAVAGLEWLLGVARPDGAGLAWPNRPGDDGTDPMLYSGTAGIVLTLLDGYRHLGDERYADAALRGATGLAAVAADWDTASLYFGLTGMAVALHAVHDVLGDAGAGVAARRALRTVAGRFDGTRWGPQFELLGGNAGIALGALAVGDVDLALLATEPYRRTAERTAYGVHWETRVGRAARQHHVSHGTLGIAAALAATGRAADRPDLVELALSAAADVVARNEAGPDGFLVPHSDPLQDKVERYNYGWCQGPAGDAQAFRWLRHVTGDSEWSALADRCWHTVTGSGLPQRLWPGFWDNNGHCCGTAGVLALACDRGAGGAEFADVLVADLAARATLDAAGARWSNVEHRATPSVLEPRTGWAMGTAGIVRELLRYARPDAGYAVPWPDHPPA